MSIRNSSSFERFTDVSTLRSFAFALFSFSCFDFFFLFYLLVLRDA